MAKSESVASTSIVPASASVSIRSDDPTWTHCRKVEGKRNQTICIYCNKHIQGGGITRVKEHLAGVTGNVSKCPKVSQEVRWQMKQLLNDLKQGKGRKRKVGKENGSIYDRGDLPLIEKDEDDVLMSSALVNTRKSRNTQLGASKKMKGIKSYFALETTPNAHMTMGSELQTEDAIHQAKLAMARWWYDANVPFSAANSKFYQPMIDAVVSMGSGFIGPNYYELRGMLLKECVRGVKLYLSEIRNAWKTYGCSIMVDGWENQRQDFIINFFVFCPKGTIFLKSVNASGLTKDVETLYKIFDDVVQCVGPENIVQLITNSNASYKCVGEKLESTHSSLFWTPCASHCIDLILEDFANFPYVEATIQKAKKVTKFIYNHSWVLALMRKEYTNGSDLCRPSVTRFATNFISIQCLMSFKKELQQMFTSDKWLDSCYVKSNVGKEIAAIVFEDKDFWVQIQHVVDISEPLVKVLCLVDGNANPSMGYLYEAMDKAKESIKERFKNVLASCAPYIDVIDARWGKQLHSPLHATGCLFNPGILFNPSFKKEGEMTRGFLIALTRLVLDPDTQDAISEQLVAYRDCVGDFGTPLAVRQRKRLHPVSWWEQFGNGTPELQRFAIRVLSQCTSATGCERNRSTFEFIHSKARNRLEHQRLNDLVFVRYNLKLQERIHSKMRDSLNPISLDNVNVMDDWVSEESTLLNENDVDVDWASSEEPFAALNIVDIPKELEAPFDDSEGFEFQLGEGK